MEAEQRKRKRRHDTQARKHTSFQVSRYPEHVFYVRRGSFPNNMAARSVECTYAFNMEYGRISFYEQQLACCLRVQVDKKTGTALVGVGKHKETPPP